MGTLEFLLEEVVKRFQPLVTRIQNREIGLLFAELGMQLPSVAATNTNFNNALTAVSTQVTGVVTKVEAIKVATEAGNKVALLQASYEAIVLLKAMLEGLKSISTSLQDDIGAAAIGISEEELESFVNDLPERLTDYLLVRTLEDNVEDLADILELLKVIKRTEVLNSSEAAIPDFTKRELDLAALIDFIADPPKYLQTIYDWNNAAFDGRKLFKILAKVLLARGIPVIYDEVNAASELNAFFAKIKIDNSRDLPGLLIEPSFDGTVSSVNIERQNWKFNAALEINFSNNAQIAIYPDGKIKCTMPGFTGGKISASWEGGYPDKPFNLISIAGGSTIEAQSVRIGFESILDEEGSGDFIIRGELNKIQIVVDLSEGDGFVKKTAGQGFETEINLKFGYSNKTGFFIEGSGAFELNLPTHLSIGPVDITALNLWIAPGESKIPMSLGADIRTALGPVLLVVNDIGFKLTLAALEKNDGNLGRFQITPGFKPPTGIGISIDAAGIKGGGVLDFDNDKKEYFGAIELDFKGMFSLKAFGILNTIMPDGSNDFSLLVIITAEFTPVQLGLGFTLNGVGGLIGINRSTRVEVLREGLKTNAIKSILFPEDVVANINRIVSDIKQVFPPQNNHYLICPMGKIGWGTPTIITLELGILIEIPVHGFVILGVLKAFLPDEEKPLLRLQVNFLGEIDFDNKFIDFRAVLFDSRLLTFTLTGEMVLCIRWGDNPVFILSVGGFHPAFKEVPADLRNMERLTITLYSSEDARIIVQTYFAITSNTVQFGARAELYASKGSFNIYGFIGYDVLFQFDPFKFIADFGAGVALRRHSSVIMSVHVSGQLSGPSPWDARGEASVSFFFFSISVPFHVTWGDRDDGTEKEKADLLELLTKEVNDNRNWKADIPANNKLHESVKKIQQQADIVVIHPFGILTFSERLLPLELEINKFGNKIPKDVNRFEIKTADPLLGTEPVKEQFAPANFTEMKDDEKLARPSFEQMKSGFRITASGALKMATHLVDKNVEYEFSYLGRKKTNLPFANRYKYPGAFFKMGTRSGAVSQSPLSWLNNRVSLNAPSAVTVMEEQYVIAHVSDMKQYNAESVAGSYTEAVQYYNELVRTKPELKDQLQVVSTYELNLN